MEIENFPRLKSNWAKESKWTPMILFSSKLYLQIMATVHGVVYIFELNCRCKIRKFQATDAGSGY